MNKNTLQYTPEGKHPEDAIHEVKSFFNNLKDVQNSYFDKLTKDLNLTKEGEDYLFDYIHNVNDADEEIDDFSHYLETLGRNYHYMTNNTIGDQTLQTLTVNGLVDGISVIENDNQPRPYINSNTLYNDQEPVQLNLPTKS